MNMTTQTPVAEPAKSCVIALHCSLGSGRQWAALAEELGSDYQMIAPDISGYGDNPGPLILPTSLAEEVELLLVDCHETAAAAQAARYAREARIPTVVDVEKNRISKVKIDKVPAAVKV